MTSQTLDPIPQNKQREEKFSPKGKEQTLINTTEKRARLKAIGRLITDPKPDEYAAIVATTCFALLDLLRARLFYAVESGDRIVIDGQPS